MSWWKKVLRGNETTDTGPNMLRLRIEMPGWSMVVRKSQDILWNDVEGDTLGLSLKVEVGGFSDLFDDNQLRRYARNIAEDRKAGLVEAGVVTGVHGPALKFIYKRLEKPAFLFTGMLLVPMKKNTWVWTIVACERGTTGVREAVVTAQLMNEGKLTLESYQTSWAQDPYDSTYRGVDRSTLCYLSDDERYDQQFPQHPLAKVRRELRRVLNVNLEQLTSAES